MRRQDENPVQDRGHRVGSAELFKLEAHRQIVNLTGLATPANAYHFVARVVWSIASLAAFCDYVGEDVARAA